MRREGDHVTELTRDMPKMFTGTIWFCFTNIFILKLDGDVARGKLVVVQLTLSHISKRDGWRLNYLSLSESGVLSFETNTLLNFHFDNGIVQRLTIGCLPLYCNSFLPLFSHQTGWTALVSRLLEKIAKSRWNTAIKAAFADKRNLSFFHSFYMQFIHGVRSLDACLLLWA